MRKDMGHSSADYLSAFSSGHSTPSRKMMLIEQHCKQSGAIKKQNPLKNSSRPFLLDIG